jgi:hypothetical protein
VKEKTVQDQKGKKRPADTARAGGAAYAPHDEGAEKFSPEGSRRRRGEQDDGPDQACEEEVVVVAVEQGTAPL